MYNYLNIIYEVGHRETSLKIFLCFAILVVKIGQTHACNLLGVSNKCNSIWMTYYVYCCLFRTLNFILVIDSEFLSTMMLCAWANTAYYLHRLVFALPDVRICWIVRIYKRPTENKFFMKTKLFSIHMWRLRKEWNYIFFIVWQKLLITEVNWISNANIFYYLSIISCNVSVYFSYVLAATKIVIAVLFERIMERNLNITFRYQPL